MGRVTQTHRGPVKHRDWQVAGEKRGINGCREETRCERSRTRMGMWTCTWCRDQRGWGGCGSAGASKQVQCLYQSVKDCGAHALP